jgi:hypothetical protein
MDEAKSVDQLPLLIHADPGARAHLLASWLKSELLEAYYDVGVNTASSTMFTKIHTDWNNVDVQAFNGIKIRIKPSFDMLPIHLHLFLTKNVYVQIPDFPKDGFGFTTVDKLLEAIKSWWHHDQQVDVNLYDKVLNFNNTYNTDSMIELFFWYNGRYPTTQQIKMLEETNKLNCPVLNRNSACSIAAMIVKQEYTKNLKEINRYWSLQNIYKNNDTSQLYNIVYDSIVPKNYGISDFHGIGINENLSKRQHDI